MSRSRDQLRMIDPGLGDVLRPQTPAAATARAGHTRDVEDAEFEIVAAAPANRRPLPAATAIPAAKPRPVFEPMPGRDSGRLGVFEAAVQAAEAATAPRFQLATAGYLGGVVAVALVAFWMAGGHSLFIGAKVPSSAKAASISTDFAPVQSKAVHRQPPTEPDVARGSDMVEVIRAAPRPPRIERAGSILMIRGGGG